MGAAAGDFKADILAVTEATTRDALGDEAYADALAEGRSRAVSTGRDVWAR